VIKAVLFDFDGTLTRPGSIDLKALRSLIGCPAGKVIIEFIQALQPAEKRNEAMQALERFELAGARDSRPNEGAEELVLLLARRGIGRGIFSNNCRASLDEAMKNFTRISLGDFNVILSRENSSRPKPHPDGMLVAAQALHVMPEELFVVGDYVFDMEAGSRAGARTAFLTNGAPVPEMGVRPDHVISSLLQCAEILGL
jgi:HAD superfamily hydrolase (TIGR01509 family)